MESSKKLDHTAAILNPREHRAPLPDDTPPILEDRDLETHFFSSEGTARAVAGASCQLFPGRYWESWANPAAARASRPSR